jgi:hypothetical protein
MGKFFSSIIREREREREREIQVSPQNFVVTSNSWEYFTITGEGSQEKN